MKNEADHFECNFHQEGMKLYIVTLYDFEKETNFLSNNGEFEALTPTLIEI